MGNLENAKDLGQSIYTKAEVNVDFAHKVSSIAGLASLGSSTPTVIVTDTDRGGIFVWSASGTANGGTVFAGSSGYWVRQYSGAVNVKWFGAKGDGVTDDIDYINYVVQNYSNVYIPSGNYAISKPIDCINNIAHNIKGDGGYRSTTIISTLSNFNGYSMLRQWSDSWYSSAEKITNPTTYGSNPPSDLTSYASSIDRYINIDSIKFNISGSQLNAINCLDFVALQETSRFTNLVFNNLSTIAGYAIRGLATPYGSEISFNGTKFENITAYGSNWNGMFYIKGYGSTVKLDTIVTMPSTCTSYPLYFSTIDAGINNLHCEANSLTTPVLESDGSDISITSSFFTISNNNNGSILQSIDASGYGRSGITITNTRIYPSGGNYTNISNYSTLLLINDLENTNTIVSYYQNSFGNVGEIIKIASYNKYSLIVALGSNSNWVDLFKIKEARISIPAATVGNTFTITHDIFKNYNTWAYISAGSVYGATGADYFNNPQQARMSLGSSWSGSEWKTKARLIWDATPALFTLTSWNITTGTVTFTSLVSSYSGFCFVQSY